MSGGPLFPNSIYLGGAADQFSEMKNDDLKNFLTLSKVEFDVKANKAELCRKSNEMPGRLGLSGKSCPHILNDTCG
jgi:hypothetical protein